MVDQQYEVGLYQYDGKVFRKLEPSGEAKIPVTAAALEVVKSVRKDAQALIGMRPELSLVASAMILEAAKLDHIAEAVKTYGLHVYSSTVNRADGDGDQPQQMQ